MSEASESIGSLFYHLLDGYCNTKQAKIISGAVVFESGYRRILNIYEKIAVENNLNASADVKAVFFS